MRSAPACSVANARSALTMPPTPMMGKPGPSSARNWEITARDRECSGAPLNPPRRAAGQLSPRHARLVVVFVAMTPSMPSERRFAASEETWPGSRSGETLTSSGTRFAVARGKFGARCEQRP